MIHISDIYSDKTADVEPADFTTTVLPWFPGAPAETLDAIAHVQDALNRRGSIIAGSAISSLGLTIR